MKVLFLRPEGSEIPSNKDFINISVLKPQCIAYQVDFRDFDGIGFTSVNAVKCFKDFDKILNKQLFAVGEVTANELRKNGFSEILVPDEYTVSNLVKLMREKAKSPILVRSQIGIDKSLEIKQIADYTLVVDEERLKEAISLLEDCKVNIVVITSSSIAKLVKDHIRDCEIIVSIGPSTTNALIDKKNIYEAKEHDMNGILKILQELGVSYG